MNTEEQFLLGLGASVATCVLWKAWPNSEQFKLTLYKMTSIEEPEKSPLAFIEHWHWGLASLIVGQLTKSNVANGFGVGMIASELFGEHPFGIGKTEYEIKGNITLGVIEGGSLLYLYAKK